MYYYKFKKRIKTLKDLAVTSDPGMAYMLHPDFIFTSLHELDIDSMEPLIFDSRQISAFDIESTYRVPTPLTYFDGNYQTITVNFSELRDRRGPLESDCSSLIAPTTEKGFTYPTATTHHFLTTHLKTQVTHRYANIPYRYNTYVFDSILPTMLLEHNFDVSLIQSRFASARGVAISPFTANIFQKPVAHIMELCTILGYNKECLSELVHRVSSRRYTFCFVGAGGTGINTAYWLSRILESISAPPLFAYVNVYETDNVEISNLLRFPIDTSSIRTPSQDIAKLTLIRPYVAKLALSKEIRYKSKFLPDLVNGEKRYCPAIYTQDKKIKNKSIILYGAPSLASRADLSPYGHFICATHADNSCSMWLNPSQDLDIQIETYGKIQLGPFFMNQLKMAIRLLEVLSTDMDLMEQDKPLLEYAFTPKMKDKYRIRVENLSSITTDEEG